MHCKIDNLWELQYKKILIVLIIDGSGSNVFNCEIYRNIKYQKKIYLRGNKFKSAIDKLEIKYKWNYQRL
ncbi:hypothetical protein [Clostridium sp. UBA1056]|uniref:hypothetical protein n=1 Tax=unclassified Clostridium TaxID=2614128 RepID=UPI0032167BA5